MSALAWNPIVDGIAVGAPQTPAWDNNAGATPGAVMGPSPTNTQYAAAALQGTAPLGGAHNTPLHVAALGLIALLVIWSLRKLGFSFSVAGKIGR